MKAKVKQSSQATLSILLVRYLIELGEDRISKALSEPTDRQ